MAIFVKLDGIAASQMPLNNRIANQNPQNVVRDMEPEKQDFARAADSVSFSDSARSHQAAPDAAARLDKADVYDAGGMSRALEGDPDRPFAVDFRH